ncbi:hypothetical protein CVV68_07770 [Arthrobacter livingstonensis]|uniref:Uncharacterized protein n=1 Tax=Arthrobacter livingstonensis TaxID=670078 RepID=A0A2V5L9P7_9MICC|nr:hypothetical protein CVV68_07770 [Arthrobacter livingstonensis]
MDEFSDPNDDGTAEGEVDRQFWQLPNSLATPFYNECLVCFLVRVVPMLEPAGFAMTLVFRETNAPRATNLGPRLQQLGIHGDTQLLQWGVVANESFWETRTLRRLWNSPGSTGLSRCQKRIHATLRFVVLAARPDGRTFRGLAGSQILRRASLV